MDVLGVLLLFGTFLVCSTERRTFGCLEIACSPQTSSLRVFKEQKILALPALKPQNPTHPRTTSAFPFAYKICQARPHARSFTEIRGRHSSLCQTKGSPGLRPQAFAASHSTAVQCAKLRMLCSAHVSWFLRFVSLETS